MGRMQEAISEVIHVKSKLVKNYFILMNMQLHECEHGCPLKVKKSLHLSGFLFVWVFFCVYCFSF